MSSDSGSKFPVTVKGWLQLAVAVVAVTSALGGGVWKLHSMNAYASDLERVETYASEGIKTATCTALDFKIEDLQREKADYPSEWTGKDEAYLQRLLRRWEQYCISDT